MQRPRRVREILYDFHSIFLYQFMFFVGCNDRLTQEFYKPNLVNLNPSVPSTSSPISDASNRLALDAITNAIHETLYYNYLCEEKTDW